MAKVLNPKIKEDIDAIMASALAAKDKDLAIAAYFDLKVKRNEDVVDVV